MQSPTVLHYLGWKGNAEHFFLFIYKIILHTKCWYANDEKDIIQNQIYMSKKQKRCSTMEKYLLKC